MDRVTQSHLLTRSPSRIGAQTPNCKHKTRRHQGIPAVSHEPNVATAAIVSRDITSFRPPGRLQVTSSTTTTPLSPTSGTKVPSETQTEWTGWWAVGAPREPRLHRQHGQPTAVYSRVSPVVSLHGHGDDPATTRGSLPISRTLITRNAAEPTTTVAQKQFVLTD